MAGQKLVILTGPTAVGKTKLSIALAKRLNGEIISADSMQVYRGMDIGTAKISEEEMADVPHHLIDEFDPDDDFNVTVFQDRAAEAVRAIAARGKLPIVVGGTGFYIQALLYDVAFPEEDTDGEYRASLERIGAVPGGADVLHGLLAQMDPKSAAAIHPNNRKRVIRALEYLHHNGSSIAEHNEEQRARQSEYDFKYLVITEDREILYERINKRVDAMLAAGLVEEVRRLKEAGYGPELVSMQGIGYKEVQAFLDGKTDEATMIETIKRNTRQFAKRQETWFRRERDVCYFNKSDYKNEAALLDALLEEINHV